MLTSLLVLAALTASAQTDAPAPQPEPAQAQQPPATCDSHIGAQDFDFWLGQ